MKTEPVEKMPLDSLIDMIKRIVVHIVLMIMLSCIIGALFAPLFYNTIAEKLPSDTPWPLLLLLKIILWAIAIALWAILIAGNIIHRDAIG